jgi:hypothetical protein
MIKKITTILILLFLANKSFSQLDSSRLLRDSIYNHKANYVGQPLSKLISDLKVVVWFGKADNAGNRTKGTAFYQNTYITINVKTGFPVSGFKIKLANKVYVELGDLRKIGHDAWDKKLSLLLGKEILVDFEKY